MQGNDTPFIAPPEVDPEEENAKMALDVVFGEIPGEGEAAADPFEIETLTLPSGAKVEFRSLATVTAENVRYLRKALDGNGAGSVISDMAERAANLLIVRWDAADTSGRPLKVPRDDDKAWGKLGYLDSRALEKHLGPHVRRLVGLGDAGK